VVQVNVGLCLNTGGIQLARPGRPEIPVAGFSNACICCRFRQSGCQVRSRFCSGFALCFLVCCLASNNHWFDDWTDFGPML